MLFKKIVDILKQLFATFRRQNIKSLKNEGDLIGLWKTEDDGGLHMISGQALEFHKNGEGIYYSWATTDPDPYDQQEKINWKWINETTIAIKNNSPDAQWEEIFYEINFYVGSYNIKYKRLTSPNFKAGKYFKEGFWKVLYPLLQPDQ